MSELPRSKTHVLRDLRWVGLLEGVSFLALLLIAMPLKYGLDWPHAVRVVGMAHGVLFVAFVLLAIRAAIARRWALGRLAFALVMSVIPAGTFWLDHKLRQEESAAG